MNRLTCDCVTQLNEQLRIKGVEIVTSLIVNFKTGASGEALRLNLGKATDKRRPNNAPKTIGVNFCPFCGLETGGWITPD